jgi:DNA repair protein RecO (recombination protein O)
VNELRDEAVVLRTYRSGEADLIAILWTRQHGKVRALAKGARKPSSRLGASYEVLAHVVVDLVESRGGAYVTRNVRHVERFMTLRNDYDRIAAGYAVVEAVDALPGEGPADAAIFDTVVRVLVALNDERYRPQLVPAAFFLRLLALDGSAPVLDSCVNCGSPGPLVAFQAQVGGALCRDCRSGTALTLDALALLQRISGGDLAAVLAEEPAEGAHDVASLCIEAIENHLGRRLKSARGASTSVDR